MTNNNPTALDRILDRANALANIAAMINRDLRNMRHPSISRGQIRNRVLDYLDNPDIRTIDIDEAVLELASHPAIRSAVRP